MAIQAGGEQGGIFSSINITPLTDIFLVLLIIFMVATAITIESAAHVDLPKLQSAANQNPRGVTVTYSADHHIYVNEKVVTEAELSGALRDALGKSSDKLVVFNGDPQVILGDMVRILDIAKQAGAGQIALAVSNNGGESSLPMPSAMPAPAPVIPSGGGPAPEPVAPNAGGMP
jgi:biopolymer transport protein ExbD